MTINLVAVARIEFPPHVNGNVQANLSFKENFFFYFLVRANVQNLLAQREKERGRSCVWADEGCDPIQWREALRLIRQRTRPGLGPGTE